MGRSFEPAFFIGGDSIRCATALAPRSISRLPTNLASSGGLVPTLGRLFHWCRVDRVWLPCWRHDDETAIEASPARCGVPSATGISSCVLRELARTGMKALRFFVWFACMILGLYGILMLALTEHHVAALLLSPVWIVWACWTLA